jgi:hypothetical protein
MTKTCTYGVALSLINNGDLLSRESWSPSEFVFLVPGSQFNVSRPPLLGIFKEGTAITYRPHIDKRNVDGSIGTWTPSNEDQLANDWYIVG